MIDNGDCGAISGIKIGRRNRSTRRKRAPVSLCPPQIPHEQTRARTRAAAVGSQRLTAWAMARPSIRQLVADVPSGLSLTPPKESKKKFVTVLTLFNGSVSAEDHPLHEPGHVIPRVGILKVEKSCVSVCDIPTGVWNRNMSVSVRHLFSQF
jgi:hypothetical protein